MSGIPVPVAGATGALLALLALVAMVSHVVMGGSGSANERRVGACCPCEAGLVPRWVHVVMASELVLQLHCR